MTIHIIQMNQIQQQILPELEYLNIGKQVSKSMRGLGFTKEVHRLIIGLNKV